MSGFKGKGKGRSGSSSSALRSNQKRSSFFSGRSNSASASDDHVLSSSLQRAAIGSLLPEKSDTELTYADIIQALNSSFADSNSSISDTLPPTKSLLSLQFDLDKLLKLNAKNIEECDGNLSKIKRLSAAIERENVKRSKLNPTINSTNTESKSTVISPVDASLSQKGTAVVQKPSAVQDQLDSPDPSDTITIKTETDSRYNALVTDNIGLEEDSLNDNGHKVTPEYEKNPKSEFVEPQELPIAILGLFDENAVEDGLPVNGEEYLKKKYGVASYPTDDLKSQLPGEIPDMDFTKAKPPNQVQFSTFSSYIEPYFRQYTEEDLAFLQQKFIAGPAAATGSTAQNAAVDPNQAKKALLSPYIIPPLGPLYSNTWAAEDGPNAGYSLSPPPMPSKEEVEAKGTSDSILDDALETETISCGPLASRLLAALMSETSFEDEIKKETDSTEVEEANTKIKTEEKDGDGDVVMKMENGVSHENENDDNVDPVGDTAVSTLIDGNWKISSLKTDYGSLEDRLKREFKYVGILDINLLQKEEKIRQRYEMKYGNGAETVPGGTPRTGNGANSGTGLSSAVTGSNGEDFGIDWIKGREDDEICHEMRILQRELRRVSYLNRAYKHRLYPIVQEQMAWQEYSHILEDLDKQVDQAYLRRTRANTRTKKKKSLVSHPSSAAGGAGAGAGGAGAGASAAGAAANSLEQPQRLKALLDKRMKWITKIGPVFRKPQEMKRIPISSVFEGIRYPPTRHNHGANGSGIENGDAGNSSVNGVSASSAAKRLAYDFEDDELGDFFEELGGDADENDDLYGNMIRSTSTPGK